MKFDFRDQCNARYFQKVKPDVHPIPEVISSWKLDADRGDSKAQLCYGMCLFAGSRVAQNQSLGAHYFKLSADQCNPDA
jgi:TPR repeat protein